ncbi:hypothetical protein DFS34DRAFT_495699 [Phlyctochytrium arcticum]|nr:hypothetical protein DFS34DRAFT_495699 [Phlyctochytrium arcticum]
MGQETRRLSEPLRDNSEQHISSGRPRGRSEGRPHISSRNAHNAQRPAPPPNRPSIAFSLRSIRSVSSRINLPRRLSSRRIPVGVQTRVSATRLLFYLFLFLPAYILSVLSFTSFHVFAVEGALDLRSVTAQLQWRFGYSEYCVRMIDDGARPLDDIGPQVNYPWDWTCTSYKDLCQSGDVKFMTKTDPTPSIPDVQFFCSTTWKTVYWMQILVIVEGALAVLWLLENVMVWLNLSFWFRPNGRPIHHKRRSHQPAPSTSSTVAPNMTTTTSIHNDNPSLPMTSKDIVIDHPPVLDTESHPANPATVRRVRHSLKALVLLCVLFHLLLQMASFAILFFTQRNKSIKYPTPIQFHAGMYLSIVSWAADGLFLIIYWFCSKYLFFSVPVYADGQVAQGRRAVEFLQQHRLQ